VAGSKSSTCDGAAATGGLPGKRRGPVAVGINLDQSDVLRRSSEALLAEDVRMTPPGDTQSVTGASEWSADVRSLHPQLPHG